MPQRRTRLTASDRHPNMVDAGQPVSLTERDWERLDERFRTVLLDDAARRDALTLLNVSIFLALEETPDIERFQRAMEFPGFSGAGGRADRAAAGPSTHEGAPGYRVGCRPSVGQRWTGRTFCKGGRSARPTRARTVARASAR